MSEAERGYIGPGRIEDEDVRRRLAKLGYVDGGSVYRFRIKGANFVQLQHEVDKAVGLCFFGPDGHASYDGQVYEIVSRKPLGSEVIKAIEEVVKAHEPKKLRRYVFQRRLDHPKVVNARILITVFAEKLTKKDIKKLEAELEAEYVPVSV